MIYVYSPRLQSYYHIIRTNYQLIVFAGAEPRQRQLQVRAARMIVPIQYLRGIAALMVVYHHIAFQLIKRDSNFNLPISSIGAAGVDIFFIISGFVMWISTRTAKLTPAQFMQHRIIRIVPLYWAITLLLAMISLFAPQLLGVTSFKPWHILASLFFVPVEHPRLSGEILPFLIQGWTLNYEMFFYIIFAIAMIFSRIMMFISIMIAFIALITSGIILDPSSIITKFYTSPILFEFLFGVALAQLYLRGLVLPRSGAWFLIGAGVVALIIAGIADVGFGPSGVSPERVIYWGLPSLCITAGVVFLARQEQREGGVFWKLGEISYSLYLTHTVVLPAMSILWCQSNFSFHGFSGIVFSVTTGVITVFCGLLSYQLFERPVMLFLKRK